MDPTSRYLTQAIVGTPRRVTLGVRLVNPEGFPKFEAPRQDSIIHRLVNYWPGAFSFKHSEMVKVVSLGAASVAFVGIGIMAITNYESVRENAPGDLPAPVANVMKKSPVEPMLNIAITEQPFEIGPDDVQQPLLVEPEPAPLVQSPLPFAPVADAAGNVVSIPLPQPLPRDAGSSSVRSGATPQGVARAVDTGGPQVADYIARPAKPVRRATGESEKRDREEKEPSAMVLDTPPSAAGVAAQGSPRPSTDPKASSPVQQQYKASASSVPTRSSKPGRLVGPVEESVPHFRAPMSVSSTK